MKKIRLLLMRSVDIDNVNAQSLTAREIALRLDPQRFEVSVWYEHEPDPRLRGRANVRLLFLRGRGKTLRVFRELLSGYDVIAYLDYSPASYLYLHLPRALRGKARTVLQAEAPVAQMTNPPWMLRCLYRGIIPRCDFYTGVTEFVRRDVSAASGRTAQYVFPLGVDCRSFSPPPSRSNPVLTVLFVATLIERKGPQLVVEAAARFPGTRFRLVGKARDGYDQVLHRKITEMGLTNVILDGPRSQQELPGIMRESDIFLLPSRLEGLPKVTLEAAASGLPCIVFRDYETPSVVDGVTGFQVTTMEEMMQRLGEMIGNAELRGAMGEAARQHAQKFDWDVVYRVWEDAYLKIAGSAP